MIVTNAITPSGQQIQEFLSSDFEGPVCMLNLINYKSKAEYEDGRQTDLSGEEAYRLYGAQMQEHVLREGGAFLFYGSAKHMMIGEVEEAWQSVAIVQYPSKERFVEIVSAPPVQDYAVHRVAGLKGQLLIATQQPPMPG